MVIAIGELLLLHYLIYGYVLCLGSGFLFRSEVLFQGTVKIPVLEVCIYHTIPSVPKSRDRTDDSFVSDIVRSIRQKIFLLIYLIKTLHMSAYTY